MSQSWIEITLEVDKAEAEDWADALLEATRTAFGPRGALARQDSGYRQRPGQQVMQEPASQPAHVMGMLPELHEDPALADPALADFLEARQRVTPWPEVEGILASWASRYRIAAITNGNADIHRTPLGPYFSASSRTGSLRSCSSSATDSGSSPFK